MFRRLFFLLVVLLVCLAAVSQQEQLPPWTPGNLDIHQISTGRGNSAFFIFPDGTTMLVDAGAAGDGQTIPFTDPFPNASRRAGEWIARYVLHMLPPGYDHLDYALVTHFHADHIGQVTPASPPSPDGSYELTGISDVANALPIRTLIDRGYDFLPPPPADPVFANYMAFTAERKRKGLKVEKIAVGRRDQIVMVRDPAAYKDFEVRNVAADGDVWTGDGTGIQHIFPALDSLAKSDYPSENMCSIGLRIRYGKFDYFTGGDIPGLPQPGAPEWQEVETAVARAIGPTDVHVVDHHGSIEPESPFFLKTLRSRVIVVPAWSPTHPSPDVLKRILSQRLYPGPRDVFVTALREPTQATIGSRANQVKAKLGHIVIRVAPGGDTYMVYVLDNTSENYSVLAKYGPYAAE